MKTNERREPGPAYPQNVHDLAAHDPELQTLASRHEELEKRLDRTPRAYSDMVEAVLDTYAERPALGYRAYALREAPDGSGSERRFLPEFRTVSYRHLHVRIRRLAAAWRDHPVHHVAPGEFVCMLGSTSIDYVTIDLACVYVQAVSVPLQATLGGELSDIMATIMPVVLAVTVNDLPTAADLAIEHPSVRSIMVFDHDPAIDRERALIDAARITLAERGAHAALVELNELISFLPSEAWQPLPPSPEGLERMALLVHSSGSTGRPKGAIYTERLAVNIWTATPAMPVVRVAYAPMNHMVGRAMVYGTLARGGTCYVTATPDLSELFEDIRLVRPTEIAMLPRLLDVIHRHWLGEVVRRGGAGPDEERIKAEVMAEIGAGFLGGRVCMLSCASAPTTPEVARFISECFQLPLNDSYGMTETGAIMVDGRIKRPPIIDYKLCDVPELGYSTRDKPFPRGELWVKTETPTPGYYKQPEATAALFDENGYLRTGDVMEERAPDVLVYLERSNDVLKLSQGEFIAIGALGTHFENHCPAVSQIYIYGNSANAYLLAVIVPDEAAIRAALGVGAPDEAIRSLVRAQLKEAVAAADLRAVDLPRDFILEQEPFSINNGLLTSVGKRRRAALKARYGERLEQLYDDFERRQNVELRALYDDDNVSVHSKVTKALEASLGIHDASADLTANFAGHGGDSLAAVSFAALLSEIFGVEISVNTILSPTGSIVGWTRAIETALAGGMSMPTFSDVHGVEAVALNGSDLDILRFLDEEVADQAPRDLPAREPRCVFLTGATGYLGRFLCLEWLERLAPRGGKLICLIRAADEGAAMERLTAAFASDPKLARRFADLAASHLEVRLGNVAEPLLGLGEVEHARLAQEVDHIVHCGALVNHILPYKDLFTPNVAGTAQLVRLALTHRQKGLDFISTLAVVGYLAPGLGRSESTPLLETIPLTNAHARGYAASKWAAEHVLRGANRRFGLPVNIFRCNMLLTNRRFDGQINLADSFSRLLYSLVLAGTAPASFYERREDGAPRRGHYDGLPVDFVAAAIVGIGDVEPQREARTFHVLNHHRQSGISLDSFADWIAEAGYPLSREQEHGSWLTAFRAKLAALPDDTRQRSVLPVLASVERPLSVPSGADHIDSANFIAAVADLPIGLVPELDRELIRKYLHDFRSFGMIPEAASLQAQR